MTLVIFYLNSLPAVTKYFFFFFLHTHFCRCKVWMRGSLVLISRPESLLFIWSPGDPVITSFPFLFFRFEYLEWKSNHTHTKKAKSKPGERLFHYEASVLKLRGNMLCGYWHWKMEGGKKSKSVCRMVVLLLDTCVLLAWVLLGDTGGRRLRKLELLHHLGGQETHCRTVNEWNARTLDELSACRTLKLMKMLPAWLQISRSLTLHLWVVMLEIELFFF